MIKILNDYSKLEEITKLAFELNQSDETRCKSMADDNEGIYNGFKRRIDDPNDEILLYVENDIVIGVCGLSPEHSIKYVQTSGGIFATKDFEKVSNYFYEFILEKYKGYEFYSSYAGENVNALNFWIGKGAVIDLDSIIYEIDLSKYKPTESILEELTIKDYDEFKVKLNNFVPDAFWNGDMMIQEGELKGGFKVVINKVHGEITDFIATRVGPNSAETYFVYSENDSLEMYKQLFSAALNNAKSICNGNLSHFVEKDNNKVIQALEEVGFRRTGTSTTYYIESL